MPDSNKRSIRPATARACVRLVHDICMTSVCLQAHISSYLTYPEVRYGIAEVVQTLQEAGHGKQLCEETRSHRLNAHVLLILDLYLSTRSIMIVNYMLVGVTNNAARNPPCYYWVKFR